MGKKWFYSKCMVHGAKRIVHFARCIKTGVNRDLKANSEYKIPNS